MKAGTAAELVLSSSLRIVGALELCIAADIDVKISEERRGKQDPDRQEEAEKITHG